jgi:hypothetical protein
MTSVLASLGPLGLALGAATIWLFRANKLSFRYLAGWCVVGVGLVVTSLVSAAVGRGRHTSLEVLAVGGLTLLIAILVQLSISVSGLQRQVRDVAERLALLLADRDATDPEPDA